MTNIPDATPDPRDVIAAIRARRAYVPKRWQWARCYELEYDDGETRKHWALKNPDGRQDKVVSAVLVLENHFDTYFDRPTNEERELVFVEHAPTDIDALLAIIDAQAADLLDARDAAAEAEERYAALAESIEAGEIELDALLTDFENQREDHNGTDLNNFYTDMTETEVIGRLRKAMRGAVATNPGAAQDGEREA